MNRIGGPRRKSRHKFKKDVRTRGKVSTTRFMQTFKEGQTVHLIIEPSVHRGLYNSRFLGKTGIIKAAKGKCYEVLINDHGKQKTLTIHPVHLKEGK